MLRIVSPLLETTTSLSSAILYVFSGNTYNASLGNFKRFNASIPIARQSADISNLIPDANNIIKIPFPSDASSIFGVTIANKAYQPSKSPDDLQPGEYKLDFANLRIILKLL